MKTLRKRALLLGLGLVGVASLALALCVVFEPTALDIICTRKAVAPDIRLLETQLEKYKSVNGVYPSTEQGLQALGVVPKDAWDRDYVYRYPGKRYPNAYDLFSSGADWVPDTADDEWGK